MTPEQFRILSISVGWILIAGTTVSYIPQYVKLYRRRETRGISQIMLIMGVLSGWYNFTAAVQLSLPHLREELSIYTVTPLLQILSPFVCFLILYSQYVHYLRAEQREYITENLHWSKSVVIVSCLIFLGMILFSCINLTPGADGRIFGMIMNIVSGLMSVGMWIPQIISSSKEKEAKSLSLWSLGIHAAGCFIVVIYQAILSPQSPWDVIPFALSGVLEIVIIVICLSHSCRTRRRVPRSDYGTIL